MSVIADPSRLGIVIIGRNEGKRLVACFDSLPKSGVRCVYVDSGSSDGSVEQAAKRGIAVVELDMSRPFSAARARNEGWQGLASKFPNLQYIQFIDGDCQLQPQWIESATSFLAQHDDYAAVCGRRRELYPDATVYNRLADMEWNTPTGETQACGGDSLFRLSALEQVAGFDPTVVAGEEPELCSRLREQGWRFWRLDKEMTWHDAAMSTYSQWWKRALRTGYGGYIVTRKRPHDPLLPFARQGRSARTWALMWPLLVIVATIAGWCLGGTLGMAIGFSLTFLLLPMQIARIAWKKYRSGISLNIAIAYAWLIMTSKFAELKGQLRAMREMSSGKEFTIVEHRQD